MGRLCSFAIFVLVAFFLAPGESLARWDGDRWIPGPGQKVVKRAPPKPLTEKDRKEARDALLLSYRLVMSKAHPHLNYITTRTTKTKGGYALWARHEYFGAYTLSIGDTAKVIQMFIDATMPDLIKGKIVKVGVQSSAGYGGSSWLNIGN